MKSSIPKRYGRSTGFASINFIACDLSIALSKSSANVRPSNSADAP